MGFLNRSAAVVRPRRPYLEWALETDASDLAQQVYEDSQKNPHVYLLPQTETDEDRKEVQEGAWAALFEYELMAWHTDPEGWPQNRTMKMFFKWFDVTFCQTVEDITKDDLVDYDDVEEE